MKLLFQKTNQLFRLILLLCLVLMFSVLPGCTGKPANEVVIYTSVDQMFSEPILQRFEEESGIKVQAAYDVEATKTTGLVNRLIAEKDNPQADVFWNGEFAQTILLQENGVLASYEPEAASDIPAAFRDSEYEWIGFGGRARVLIVNRDLLDEENYPRSIFDLLSTEVPADLIGIAYPIFGTTATHSAALYAELGPEAAKRFFTDLRDMGIRIVDGNSVVRDMVVSGELVMGMTDTDDANVAIRQGKSVDIVFLDQAEDEMGTLIIPNTVAKIKGAPNPDNAKKLIEFLVSLEIEQTLLEDGWIDMTVRPAANNSDTTIDEPIRELNVPFAEIYNYIEQAKEELAEVFIR